MQKKKRGGRTRATLTKRFVMRCTPDEFMRWEQFARERGMSGVAPLVRKATNDVVAAAVRDE